MTEPPHDPERRAVYAERQLQLLIGSVRDYAMFMLDRDGRIETWNIGAQLIKGYQAHEIVGNTIHAFYTPEDRAAHKPDALLAEARDRGRVEDEGWRVRKDGTRFWADVVITALRETDGELVGYVKVTRDLTERRQAEMDRLHLAHTEEALRLRDEFLSIAAHELRTPLVALQLQIDSLREQGGLLDPRQLSKLNRASRNIQRMTDLITALLDVTRISQGHLKLVLQEIDLGALVSEVIDRLEEPAHESKCKVVAVVGSGVLGSWDPLRIGQVISNLLANAFRYAAGSRIEVHLARVGDDAILRVEDGGPGIPEDRLDRIFERFERAAPARNYGGLGLGLYVARKIVVAHDGKITARNREGGGAVVEITLPIRDTPSPVQGQP
ncbi:MAG TPA: PAS domain-containing sensor histidine kinase [Kofleriaceae bacterium]|nr:PAS domain-containing sensor histidine kinase [Kofleriaceae bacterium]